jgi:hypothetical protein
MYMINVNPAEKWTASDGAGFGARQLGADDKGNVYIAGQAAGAIGQYDFVAVDHVGQIRKKNDTAEADMGRTLGSMAIALADNEWGWVLACGVGRVNVVTAAAANVMLYTTATDGRLDDTAANQKILGIQLTTARGSGNGDAPCVMNWPKSLGSST